MKPWPAVRLGEIATVERGIVDADSIHGGTLYVGLENIAPGGQLLAVAPVAAGEIASSKFSFADHHVLFGKLRPYLAKIARPSFAGVCSTDILPLLPSARIDRDYLTHFLLRPETVGWTAARATGANLPRLSPRVLLELEVPLPAIQEQRRIAEVLDRADDLRAKRRVAIATLRDLQQSMFLDLFGDPATNPKSWFTMPLGQLLERAELFTDGDWVESKDQDPGGDVRLVQLADVGDGLYLNKSARFLTRETAKRLRCTFLNPGDLLLARMPDPLGRACLFPGDQRACVTVVDVCVIRPSKEGPDPVWLMSCLNATGFRQQIARQATGTTRERISRGNLARLPIICPPIELQREFAKRAAVASELHAEAAAALIALDRLFASLQQRAFSGHL